MCQASIANETPPLVLSGLKGGYQLALMVGYANEPNSRACWHLKGAQLYLGARVASQEAHSKRVARTSIMLPKVRCLCGHCMVGGDI